MKNYADRGEYYLPRRWVAASDIRIILLIITKAKDRNLGSLPSLGPGELRCPLCKGFVAECTVKLFNFSLRVSKDLQDPAALMVSW